MRIVNFGQVVDLEHGGGFAHQFTVALDSGERLSIITDEDTVQQLIEIAMMMAPDQPQRPQHLKVVDQPGRNVEEDPDIYPGGDPGEMAPLQPVAEADLATIYVKEDEGPAEIQPVMGQVAEVPVKNVPTGVQPGGLGQPKPPVRRQPNIDADGFMISPPPKTVPTDEMGYPITANSKREPEPEVEEEDVGEQI